MMNPAVTAYERDFAERHITKWMGDKAELAFVMRQQKENNKRWNRSEKCHKVSRTDIMEQYKRLEQEIINMPFKSKQNSRLYREKCKELRKLYIMAYE